LLPSLAKAMVKRFVFASVRTYNRWRHIERGRFVEFGYSFRFDRESPYRAKVGDCSIAEAHNVWNAGIGNIVVGRECWFGLYNLVMGPVEIGDRLSTGPFVRILGPRHPTSGYKQVETKTPTRIGNDVWISTGAILLFGIQVGDRAVISAGSVVTEDVPADSVLVQRPRTFILPRWHGPEPEHRGRDGGWPRV
jgi:acetyltransferase-like isoleucine patch superfamily enzyme